MPRKLNIAIIGTGISGLGAAYMLHKKHDVVLFEKNNYIGGHSNTVEVKFDEKTIPVDTGFIVFNKKNYPNLTKLFDQHSVPYEKSDMSFSVSMNEGDYEYSNSSLFASRSNLINPKHIKMLLNILKFNKNCESVLNRSDNISLGGYLDEMKLGEYFKERYILPMGSAIWSCPLDKMLEFPAKTFIQFFKNHGLNTLTKRPQWYTVSGGSKEYVKILTRDFKDNIRLNTKIDAVQRLGKGVMVNKEKFDHVIFATHADQTLNILKSPSIAEKQIIGQFKYQPNKVYLHQDESLMPKRKSAWASWNYMVDDKGSYLTYYMNQLQNIDKKYPLFVTVNPPFVPNNAKASFEYEHPVFNQNAVDSQKYIKDIQTVDKISFCGAWQGYGFHEDGFTSGIAAAVNILDKWK